MSQLNKKYDPIAIQKDKVSFWQKNQLFKADVNSNKEPFVCVLPPPNVTGHLHIGHAYGFTLPDILVRYKKLQGYDAFIIPGTDHAGIATQTKFEKILKQTKQIDRFSLGRTEFINQLIDWKNEQADYIKKQWDGLGLSLDYSNYMFTLDEYVVDKVKEVFVKMYKEGIIYRAKKLVNWDVQLKTAISNIEVIHKEVDQKLYYIKYYSKDKKNSVLIATSRPETMYGDKYLVINPNDKRYKDIHNTTFINPVNNQELKIILDEYVDIEFGTGVMKCTPAHDFNDYELAKKHNLEFINILNEDGTLNELCQEFSGMDRLVARQHIVEKLKNNGFLVEIKTHKTSVGFSERTDEVVEPFMSYQWFIKMDTLVNQTIKMQNNEEQKTNFYPNRFNKTLMTWLEKTEDWCISRQLWWGHQIPVWYNKNDNSIYCDINPPKDLENWVQDEDVLDTWFSSGIWPIFTTKWQENEQFFNRYFPTSIMVTGVDILFFWVSRMMNFSQYLLYKRPFNDVLIHGLIRDSQGRKMSKSLNNGIDPFDVINQYGLDAMRLFFASSTTIGEDLNFSDEKLAANWNYLNKIWNIAKYIEAIPNHHFDLQKTKVTELHQVNQWILQKFNELVDEVTKNMDKYNLVVASKLIYDFIWDVFASNYLEFTKIMLQDETIVAETSYIIRHIFNQLIVILHPFAPNISEEIWLKLNNSNESILLQSYPKHQELKTNTIIDDVILVISEIRKLRLNESIANKTSLEFDYVNDSKLINNLDLVNQILKIVNTTINSKTNEQAKQYTYELVINDLILKTTYQKAINYNQELIKLNNQLEFVQNEINRVEKLLSNPGYINKAPEALIKKEKEKQSSLQSQKENILMLIKTTKEKLN